MDKNVSRYDLFTASRHTWFGGKAMLFWDRPVKHIRNKPLQSELLKDTKFLNAIARLRKNSTICNVQVRGPFKHDTLYPWMKK